MGRIRKGVAKWARWFDMTVLCYDKVEDSEFTARYGVRYAPLDVFLESADFVTLHLPLTSETGDFVGERELSRMKKMAFLISTARAEIMDKDPLCAALTTGGIVGAVLYAFWHEPPTSCRLLRLDNVVPTPHIGGHTGEAIERPAREASENLMAVLIRAAPAATV